MSVPETTNLDDDGPRGRAPEWTPVASVAVVTVFTISVFFAQLAQIKALTNQLTIIKASRDTEFAEQKRASRVYLRLARETALKVGVPKAEVDRIMVDAP